MLNPEFVIKVSSVANNRTELVEMLNNIDSEKREVKAKLQNFSNSPKTQTGVDNKTRERMIRSLSAKQGHLNDEREYIYLKLKRLNTQRRALNAITNNKKAGLADAFMASAELILPQEQFIEIELNALNMLKI